MFSQCLRNALRGRGYCGSCLWVKIGIWRTYALASDGGEANLELEFRFRVKESEGRMKERELARLRRLNDELLRYLETERIRREKRRQRMEREIDIRAA